MSRYVVVAPMKVKSECIDEFIVIADANAQESRKESGILLFDAIQSTEDPSKFMLVEQYATKDDHLKHRETEHFANFKEKTSTLLEKPYKAEFYHTVSETF